MNEFKTYHPIVNFTYFVFVIGFCCFFMHPACLPDAVLAEDIILACGRNVLKRERKARGIEWKKETKKEQNFP